MSQPGGDCCCKASAYMYGSIYVCRHIIYTLHIHIHIRIHVHVHTHTFAVTWMNYDGQINSSRLTLMLILISLAWLPKSIFGQLENAKNHMRHKSSGKKHANPPFEAWICELCFVGSHAFCWTLAHETNHNNIGETRNKPVSQFPSFGCVNEVTFNEWSLLSFKVNCFLRGSAVEVPNLGKISLCVDVVGLVLRTMSMCKYKNEYIYIYILWSMYIYIYPMPMYNWCRYLLVYLYYEVSIFHDDSMALHHHHTRNFTSF